MAPDQTTCGFVYTSGLEIHVCGKPPLHEGLHRPAPTPGMPHPPAEDARPTDYSDEAVLARIDKRTAHFWHMEDGRDFDCCANASSVPVPPAQPGRGATDTAGTETDRGPGERGPHTRSEAIEHGRRIAMTAMDLAKARYRHERGQPHRREHCEACAREAVAEAARPVHYREAAASLTAIAAARLDTAPDAIAYARAEGIRIAAEIVASTARDLTEGDTE